MKKLRNNYWLLLVLFFLLPLLASVILALFFGGILEHTIVKQIISISGFCFTLSSLILVFILFRNFKPSEYHKNINEENYLKGDAISELQESLTVIETSIYGNKTKNLAESCNSVLHIYHSLTEYEDDVILKAYSNKIKKLMNLINKHKLTSIGLSKDHDKLKKIPEKHKQRVWEATNDLKKYLNRM